MGGAGQPWGDPLCQHHGPLGRLLGQCRAVKCPGHSVRAFIGDCTIFTLPFSLKCCAFIQNRPKHQEQGIFCKNQSTASFLVSVATVLRDNCVDARLSK